MRLDVERVGLALGGVDVLRDVTLSVGPGTFVGLVGPNGAGKTSLLRTMNGALSPDTGTVRVGDDAVADLSSKATSRRVATVPQNASFAFDFTVREIVEMGRHPHRSRFGRPDDGDVVGRAMARTQVAALADRAVSDVSGGERQRVLLARALAQDAPVLLLDEPTASLDITHQVRTLDLVRGLVDEGGRTVVAAIHDLTLAARYCDELVVLGDGRVLDAGPPDDVLTGGALRDAFGEDAVVVRHPVTGTPLVTARSEGGPPRDASVHVVGGGGSATALLATLDDAGFDVSVGVVNEGDADCETARDLGLEVVTVPPFTSIDVAAREAGAEHVLRADVTVLADLELAAGTVPNLELAAESDRLVVVDGRPLDERYVDDAARHRYERLVERAATVPESDVLDAVLAALDGSPDHRVVEADTASRPGD